MKLNLLIPQVVDKWARDNFQKIVNAMRDEPILKGSFQFREISISSPRNTYPYKTDYAHNLGFQPRDVIQLSVVPDDSIVTWNFEDFARETVSITVSKACTIRAFVGRYEGT